MKSHCVYGSDDCNKCKPMNTKEQWQSDFIRETREQAYQDGRFEGYKDGYAKGYSDCEDEE